MCETCKNCFSQHRGTRAENVGGELQANTSLTGLYSRERDN